MWRKPHITPEEWSRIKAAYEEFSRRTIHPMHMPHDGLIVESRRNPVALLAFLNYTLGATYGIGAADLDLLEGVSNADLLRGERLERLRDLCAKIRALLPPEEG